MSLETLERGVGGAVIATGAVVGAYNTWAFINRRARESRMPEGGDTQSILPFYEILPSVMEECGITMYASSGGIAKQALADPMTVFSPEELKYSVVDPDSKAIKKATLWRPGECTIRDFDIRAFKVMVDGVEYIADARFDGKDGVKAERTRQAQGLFDEHARTLGFDKGPEVSLFFYERPYDEPFRASPSNYATRTQYDPVTNTEMLYASTGKHVLFLPRGELWTCEVALPGEEPIEIAANAPAEHLGRTINRPIVERERDRADVDAAVLNIRAKGLGDVILGEVWDEHERFREWLDTALNGNQTMKQLEAGDTKTAAHMLLAKHLGVKIAPWLEASEIGKAIRDPATWIGRKSAGAMGA